LIRRIIGAAASAVAALLLVTGCAQLPQSGAIGIGPDIANTDGADYVYYSPAAPSEDASQQEIISGFLSAGNGPQNDYSVARSYLTIDKQTDWLPSEEVLIQEGPPRFTFASDTEVHVDVNISASIDAFGTYTFAPRGTQRHLVYKFAKQAGQWRLSEAPNLTMLLHPNFLVLFKPYSLYFYDSNHNFVVPDVRWFPSRASTATRLTSALLEGPQQWLKPALAVKPEPKVELHLDAVPISNSEASVDLSENAAQLPVQDLQYLKAELKATLTQLPTVTGVSISFAGELQTVKDLPTKVSRGSIGSPVALTQTGLGHLNSSTQLFSFNELKDLVGSDIRDFALNSGETNLALVTGVGVYQLKHSTIGSQATLVDRRPNLLAPHWDNRNYLWTVTNSVNSSWFTTDPSQNRIRLSTTAYVNSSISSFAISPDGSRVAVLSSGDRSGVWILPIVRNAKGAPTSLGRGVKLPLEQGTPVSVTWADSSNVSMLLKISSKSVRAVTQTIGGESVSYSAISDGVSIVASTAAPAVYILLADGTAVLSRSSIWSTVAANVLSLRYPD
jgi:hypothetical protein